MPELKSIFKNITNSFCSNSELTPFDINASSPYDQSTYLGRAKHFYAVLDPRTLLIPMSTLKHHQKLLNDYYKDNKNKNNNNNNNNKLNKEENKKLWESKQIVSSIVHPDTNAPIPALFRFSAFAVANIPICFLLLYQGGTSVQLFAQFINQSYNVGVNYFNRNASNPMSTSMLLSSYLAAVTSSCGIALGLRTYATKLAQHRHLSPFVVHSLIPYTAVTLASIGNVYFIRWNEITEGITVRVKKSSIKNLSNDNNNNNNNDNDNNDIIVGKSKVAGHVALLKCCVARMIWSVPPLFFPPIIMRMFFRKASGKMAKIIETGVIGVVLLTCMPIAMAVYPQNDTIKAKRVEKDIQQKIKNIIQISDYDLQNIDLIFNKGL